MRWLSYMCLLVLVLVGLWPAGAAAQTDCSSGDAPTGFWDEECDEFGLVCVVSPSHTVLICDLDMGGSGSASATAVFDFSAGTEFSIWGTLDTGAEFCCNLHEEDDEGPINQVIIEGSDQADTISFTFGSGAGQRDLTCGNGPVIGEARGNDGIDTITGSKDTSQTRTSGCAYSAQTCYSEKLNGGDSGDTINGSDGDDCLYGNGGGDTLRGETGSDYIEGGNSQDTCSGANGADEIDGGDNDDTLFGGNGNDILRGGTGADILKGMEDNDTLTGDVGADILCGGNTSGGGHDTLWGFDSSHTCASGCDNEILYEPASQNAPSGGTGNTTGANLCGDGSYGSTWAGANCTYNQNSQPAACAVSPP